ncbi:hypothetical protein [Lysobacter capsici]|uniref:hypothetical protein n=1 Tax=Lysobacter capsici TaxID=435897 RepID=UPI001C00898F|nr:hypothetical protein [Lysobacter capsici]QWF15564.1 hypothetical protein KME82_17475 [Lysobacter capsici]
MRLDGGKTFNPIRRPSDARKRRPFAWLVFALMLALAALPALAQKLDFSEAELAKLDPEGRRYLVTAMESQRLHECVSPWIKRVGPDRALADLVSSGGYPRLVSEAASVLGSSDPRVVAARAKDADRQAQAQARALVVALGMYGSGADGDSMRERELRLKAVAIFDVEFSKLTAGSCVASAKLQEALEQIADEP